MFYEKWSNHVDIVWVSYTYSYIIVQSCYNVYVYKWVRVHAHLRFLKLELIREMLLKILFEKSNYDLI